MLVPNQAERLAAAQEAIGYTFKDQSLLLAAFTHPSAVEGHSLEDSYERLEFLGDSIVGAIVAREAYRRYMDIDEGGLTRIKVALVAGSTLSEVASGLGFSDVIIFGESERGTGKRGMHSALENVYEAVVAALFLDGGLDAAWKFVSRTLFPLMTRDFAEKPENPKSALQERLQADGVTPTYKLVETQGPPHDRTFVTSVYAGALEMATGTGRTKKESEGMAADIALKMLRDADAEGRSLLQPELTAKEQKAAAKAEQRAAKEQQRAAAKEEKARKRAAAKAAKEEEARAKAAAKAARKVAELPGSGE